MAWPARVVSWLFAALAGAVFGVAGTIAHPITLAWFPAGLVVASVGCLALMIAVRLLMEERGSVVACGAGMIAALIVYSGEGPGGSVVVTRAAEGEFPYGITWTILLTGIVLVVTAWPRFRSGHKAKH